MREVFSLAKKMTFYTFLLVFLSAPLVFYLGGSLFFLGFVIGFLLSLSNFYFSLYAFTKTLKPVGKGKRSLGVAQGLLLLGFWLRLGVLGIILYLLARISEGLMFAALVAFLIFYGLLFVTEIRFLSRTRMATGKDKD